ncbi:kinesin-like protein KIN-14E isoform X1 [Hordeum vulgare subsp. vulgare]|uniref:Kinesin motor domain-containing protein n=1 Tax=Hordeum vulgare subsp. vulgare TaxID=112509 RepID=A0A8I6XLU1_HORVV|nr:kinesin-like protein KIN-14E isoform X1 [Hordeum vulgare subsp. vulgare]
MEAGDDPMDFTWTAGWEAAHPACDSSPDPAPDPAPACDSSPDPKPAPPACDSSLDPAPDPAPAPQEAEAEPMILVSGPRVAVSGLRRADCHAGECVLFLNAGGCAIEDDDPSAKFSSDSFFQGGESIETSESILEGGDYPSLYSSARYGDFSYRFDGLAPGDYYLDLHFAEIVHTGGPKGIRSFDVLVQEDKILSELDVFAVVGGNRPLQVLDIRAYVGSNGVIIINFKGVRGNPMVCGICVRKAPATPAAKLGTRGTGLCKKCLTVVEISSPIQKRTIKLISKYEKQIEDLTSQCTSKSDECSMAWSLVESTNQELDRLKMELHQKLVQSDNFEQVLDTQTDQLRKVSQNYENDKKLWAAAISNLESKIKAMKQEQALLSLEAHDCAQAVPDLSKMIEAVRALVAQCDDLKVKYHEEMAKRKKLHNIVQETKGNIRVFCRCRPLSKVETSSGFKCVVDFDGANDGDIGIMNGGTTKKTFKFDRVYTPKDDQAEVYADASPLVTSVLDGYNVCIFAYGQTGTGKTFTMEGTERNRGVNYRTLEELFKIAEERKDTVTYNISVSVLEVYNEQIRDLLATSPSSKKLEIKQAGEGSHHVPGIVEAKVEDINEVWDALQTGSNSRAVGSNNVNEHSSRSHCMLCIMVRAKNLINGDCTRSKLWLVDLAGSERLAKTDAQGDRLKEAQNINRSLSALGDVISALASRSSHIPYRNSKLTHLLQDSLGGDSKALMFVQISPSDNDASETLSSLNFASRVRGIELGPAKKQVDTAELQKFKQMLERSKQEVKLKDDSLRKLEENCQNLEKQTKGKEQLYKNLQEKVKELESQLDSKEKQQNQLSEKLKEKEETCTALEQKIRELERNLEQQHRSDCDVAALNQSIEELEQLWLKLKEQEQQTSDAESKIEELELKLKEQEQQRSAAESKAREMEQELLEAQKTESMLESQLLDLKKKLPEMGARKLQDANAMPEPCNNPIPRVLPATPVEANMVPPPCAREVMSEKAQQQHHRILRSSDSANKRVPSSLFAEAGVVNEKKRKGEDSHPAASARQNAGRKRSSLQAEVENQLPAAAAATRKRSLQGGEVRSKRASNPARPSTSASSRATTASVAANKAVSGSRVTRQQQATVVSSNKTKGWVR